MLFFAKSRELSEQRSAEIFIGKQLTGKDLISNIINNFPRYVYYQLAYKFEH